MNITRKLNTAVKGDDFEEDGFDKLATAGIHLSDHGNAIEIHAFTIQEAQLLRDEILTRIQTGVTTPRSKQ